MILFFFWQKLFCLFLLLVLFLFGFYFGRIFLFKKSFFCAPSPPRFCSSSFSLVVCHSILNYLRLGRLSYRCPLYLCWFSRYVVCPVFALLLLGVRPAVTLSLQFYLLHFKLTDDHCGTKRCSSSCAGPPGFNLRTGAPPHPSCRPTPSG